MQRRLSGPVGGLALLLVLGACGPFGDDGAEQAARVAERLAAELSEGGLGVTPVVAGNADEAPADSLEAVLEGVGDPATVTVDDVVVEDDTATVTLGWTWERTADTWAYATEAELRRSGDEEQRDTSDGGWELVWRPATVHPSLVDGDRLRETRLAPTRGDILGADDEALVEPRPVRRVGVDRTGLSDEEAGRAARQVARLVDILVQEYVERVGDSGERAFVEAIVFRAGDLDQGLAADLAATAGARVLEDELPLAPSRDFAAALIGTVGPATAEIVEESRGRISAGDEVGRSGLQLRYDEQLAGAAGVRFERVPGSSADPGTEDGAPEELFAAAATDGSPLRTSLDLATQNLAQRVLAGVGPPSALVALRPSTGEVVAAASGPGSEGLNTATASQYAPGSTYKIVSSLALLREGLRPGSPVTCEPTVAVDGREFENYDDYPASGLGRITLQQAVASSCNTAFISEMGRLAPEDLGEAAAALGFGVDHDLGFPAYFGQVPPAESDTGVAADLIGQGTVLASPMAMAAVLASVVEGEAVLPRLLPDVEVDQVQPDRPLTPGEAGALRQMLRAVVEEGSGSVVAGLPEGPVLAKTGTAEYGEDPPLPTHAWMVAAQGDLAVAAFVETGESGSSTAGPLLRDFLGDFLAAAP